MSYKIDQIVKAHLITDYLAGRGIHPASNFGGKLLYKCPLPSHPNDNSPSFYVYDKGDRQDFYCWGCRKSGIIINLIHYMEDQDIKEVFQRLSHGIDFSLDHEIDTQIKDIIKEPESKDDDNEETWLLAMKIAVWTQNQLEQLDFDQEFFAKCEKMYHRLDQHLAVDDLLFVQDVDEHLPAYLKMLSGQIMKERAEEEKRSFKNRTRL
jgi:hypothetical protein